MHSSSAPLQGLRAWIFDSLLPRTPEPMLKLCQHTNSPQVQSKVKATSKSALLPFMVDCRGF